MRAVPILGTIVLVLGMTSCASPGVSIKDYEAMRERAQQAETALQAERLEANELLRFAVKQDQYIRELERGMVIQAREAAKLRETCEI